MSGRELIVYILQNHLEDEPMVKDGKILGLLTAEEAAIKANVGIATIYIWERLNWIEGAVIGDKLYIFDTPSLLVCCDRKE